MEAGDMNLYSWILHTPPIIRAEYIRTILNDILCGLEYLHTNGFVHCNLNLTNVVIVNDTCKLIDFSTIKYINTSHDSIIGATSYSPPEMFMNESYFVNYTIDIWSVGIIIIKLLSGIKNTIEIFEDMCVNHTIINDSFQDLLVSACKTLANISLQCFPLSQNDKELLQDLYNSMLTRYPFQRITTTTALSHKYFLSDTYNHIIILDTSFDPPQEYYISAEHITKFQFTKFTHFIAEIVLIKKLSVATFIGTILLTKKYLEYEQICAKYLNFVGICLLNIATSMFDKTTLSIETMQNFTNNIYDKETHLLTFYKTFKVIPGQFILSLYSHLYLYIDMNVPSTHKELLELLN
jgi:serine/threonine protein kinase